MFGKKVNAPIMFDTVANCYREIGANIGGAWAAGKKFDFKQMSDNTAMKETFEKMPLRNVTLAMVLGCVALFMFAGLMFLI